ncbi:MAG: alpha/beta hydrolase [Vicinamibacterales bacterium]
MRLPYPDWRTYSRAELDAQYSPSRTARDFAGCLARYERDTTIAKARLAATSRLDVPYGPAPRQRLDVFPAVGRDGRAPIHVFIHGGFWQALSKESAGFAAPAFVDAGWTFVAVNYTLAPEARLTSIVHEVDAALRWIVDQAATFGSDSTSIVVSGHSAGAFLAASLLTTAARSASSNRVSLRGLVLVGGVYALAPIEACYVNDRLGLTPEETAALDLVAARPLADVPVRLIVGGDETAEFKRQSEALADAWRPGVTDLREIEVPGRDHFDLLFDLASPTGLVFREAIALGSGRGA